MKSKSVKSHRRFSHACIESIERRLMMSTYTVNTLSDATAPVTGQLTLRQAVADANAHAGADTIKFAPSVFTAGSLHTIALTQGEIVFTDTAGATTVNGPGQSVLAVNANGTSRDFKVSTNVTVSMSGFTITGGTFNAPTGLAAVGGGLLSNGNLNLDDVTVSNNTITGGSDTSSPGTIGGTAFGAGIYSTGALTLVNSSVTGNHASGGSSENNNGGNSSGGGIYSTGLLTVTGSSILGNNALGGGGGTPNDDSSYRAGGAQGGGIFSTGQTVLSSSNVSNNSVSGGSAYIAGEAQGGGLYVSTATTISGGTFNNNQATGGSDTSAEGGSGASAWGGAIYSTAALSMRSSTLSGDTVTGGAGTSEDYGYAGNAYGGAIAALGSLTISGSAVSSSIATGGNAGSGDDYPTTTSAEALGGGIYAAQQLAVTNCTVSMNTVQGADGGEVDADGGGPGEGGGIATLGTGTISQSEISNNVASGGVDTTGFDYHPTAAYQSGDGEGGGIFNSGALAIMSSTINGNKSTGGAGRLADGYADDEVNGTGGDGLGGGVFSSNTLNIQESTLTGNTASGGLGPDGNSNDDNAGNAGNGEGGAIYSNPAVTLADSTVVQNTVIAGGGSVGLSVYGGTNGNPGVAEGGGLYAGTNSVVDNSILSFNSGASGADVYSSLSSASGYNLIGYGGGLTNEVNGNQIGIHVPVLSTIGNNGGPTQTMLPLAGSPVLDAGSNLLIPAGVTLDQRGLGRISNGTVDIGAVEVQQNAPVITPTTVITLTPATDQTAVAGQSSLIGLGSFTQSNATGPFSITVNWGDGSNPTVLSQASAGLIPAESHTYATDGSDTVILVVTDARGNSAVAQSLQVVVSTTPIVPVAVSSTTSLSASTLITAPAATVTFTAVVTGNAGFTPTGSVSFSLAGSVLGTADLVDGYASFSTPLLSIGTDTVTAVYSGDSHYISSSASPVAVTVATPSQVTSALTKPVVPLSVVAGQKFNARLPLLLTNTGAAIKGIFRFNYYVNTTPELNGGHTPLLSLPKKISFKPGKRAVTTTIIRSLPAALPAGSYYLLTEIVDPNGLISLAATTTMVTVAAPFVHLSVIANPVTPAELTPRRPGIISLILTNTGNISATGLLMITVNPSTGVSTVLPNVLASARAKLTLAAGKSRLIKLRVRIPTTLTTGSYFANSTIAWEGESIHVTTSTTFSVG